MIIKNLDKKQITDIYKNQLTFDFPPEERKPLETILELVESESYDCNGLFDEAGNLKSYAFVVKSSEGKNILVDYLAVDNKSRGCGIGSQMISALKEKYNEYDGILIEAERIDKATDKENAKLREDRIKFYTTNGFYVTGVTSKLYGVFYSILYFSNKHINASVKVSDSLIKRSLDNVYHVLFNDKIYEEKVRYVKQNILLVAINAKYIHSNLAVYTLKKNSDEYSDYVNIAEYTINQYVDNIVQDIYKRKPDVIAFSCYIWNREYITKVIGEISKVLPDTPIWVGGPEVSYSAIKFLNEYPQVKGVMCGEGEKIFKNLMAHYVDYNMELSDISGLIYHDNKAEIVINEYEKQLDLSLVKFPYDNISDFENKIIYYESSRGCPFSCSYCLSSIDKKLRFRDTNLVKKELKFFIDNKVKQVKFVDRTFNCKKDHALKIWRFIKENDNGITNFHFEISADLIDEEELELFKTMRPGLVQFEIGVQSTNTETIKEIDRTMDLDRLKYIVSCINSYKNIHQHLDLIAGLPYEDYDSFIKSFNDVYKMEPEQLQLGFLKVLSGAKMFNKAEDYGLVYTSLPPYEVLYTKWISYDEILKLKSIENMVEIYYNSRQFTTTLKFLEKLFDTPFELFDKLSTFYENAKYNEAKHTRIAMYEILLEFVKSIYKDDKVVSELLTYDVYLRENIKTRPHFSIEEEKIKDELRPYYNRYRQAGKNLHFEKFSIDIENFIESGEVIEKDVVVMFDYRQRNPINYQVKTEVVNEQITE